MQFFWTFYSLKNAGKIYNHTALSWAANQQIIIESKYLHIIISGSCDTVFNWRKCCRKISITEIIALKSLFSRLDLPVCMRARLRTLAVSIATGTSNSSCSDALILPIKDWLFYSKGRASFNRAAILNIAFFPIQNYMSDTCILWVHPKLCAYSLLNDVL